MKNAHLRFGKGFRVSIGNKRAQAAEMVIPPGDCEGGPVTSMYLRPIAAMASSCREDATNCRNSTRTVSHELTQHSTAD